MYSFKNMSVFCGFYILKFEGTCVYLLCWYTIRPFIRPPTRPSFRPPIRPVHPPQPSTHPYVHSTFRRSIHQPTHPSICPSINPPIRPPAHPIHLATHLSTHPPVRPAGCLSFRSPIRPAIHPRPFGLPVCPSTHQSILPPVRPIAHPIHPTIHLSIQPSAHPPETLFRSPVGVRSFTCWAHSQSIRPSSVRPSTHTPIHPSFCSSTIPVHPRSIYHGSHLTPSTQLDLPVAPVHGVSCRVMKRQ